MEDLTKFAKKWVLLGTVIILSRSKAIFVSYINNWAPKLPSLEKIICRHSKLHLHKMVDFTKKPFGSQIGFNTFSSENS